MVFILVNKCWHFILVGTANIGCKVHIWVPFPRWMPELVSMAHLRKSSGQRERVHSE